MKALKGQGTPYTTGFTTAFSEATRDHDRSGCGRISVINWSTRGTSETAIISSGVPALAISYTTSKGVVYDSEGTVAILANKGGYYSCFGSAPSGERPSTLTTEGGP